MVVPLAARWVAAACGVILVLTGWQSVIGTLIVPRPVGSWLTRLVDRLVLAFYMSVTRPVTDWVRRDRILATQSAAILVGQLVAWLGIFLAGFITPDRPPPGRQRSRQAPGEAPSEAPRPDAPDQIYDPSLIPALC